MLSIQSDLNGYSHMIAIQPVQFGSLCPIISAVDFPNHIAEDDVTFMCTVTSADESCTTDNGQDKVQDLLSRYFDVFPADLPAELPPERNVFHTIPLADDKATPPPHYKLNTSFHVSLLKPVYDNGTVCHSLLQLRLRVAWSMK